MSEISDNKSIEKEDDDEQSLYVVDSDEYQKTKKLESIYQSKKEYKKIRSNRSKIIQKYTGIYRDPKGSYYQQLASSLAMYGSELSPIIEDALKEGLLIEDDLKIESVSGNDQWDILELIKFDCCVEGDFISEEGKYTPLGDKNLNHIFRHLEKIQRKLGLGLEIESETDPAQI